VVLEFLIVPFIGEIINFCLIFLKDGKIFINFYRFPSKYIKVWRYTWNCRFMSDEDKIKFRNVANISVRLFWRLAQNQDLIFIAKISINSTDLSGLFKSFQTRENSIFFLQLLQNLNFRRNKIKKIENLKELIRFLINYCFRYFSS
jgi:hypothetical protein